MQIFFVDGNLLISFCILHSQKQQNKNFQINGYAMHKKFACQYDFCIDSWNKECNSSSVYVNKN